MRSIRLKLASTFVRDQHHNLSRVPAKELVSSLPATNPLNWSRDPRKSAIGQQGLTLIELLISIVLLSILLTVFTSAFVSGIKVYQREFQTANLQSENRIVLDRIISDIKQAYNVEDTSDSDTLVLALPAIDASGNILYEATGQFKTDYFTYTKNGTSLEKEILPDASSSRTAITKTILDKVSNLTFTYLPDLSSAEEVEVRLITQDQSSGKTITVNNLGRGVLRNK